MEQTRENFAERRGEKWRPPACTEPGFLRRFFDLQAGSIWSDLASELPLVKGTLLDVGCGAQPYRRLVPPGARYRAIDSAAAAQFGYQSPDTVYYSGDRWPVQDASVDVVLCTETLEHVLDPHSFLREAFRCLLPGGRLLLTVPFAARWHFIPYGYWRFTPSSLNHLLSSTGFQRIEVFPRGNALTVACYKSMAVILQLLLPQRQRSWRSLLSQLLGILLLPLLSVCAVTGNLSLAGKGGDDCLGYTVRASKGFPTDSA